VGKIGIMPTTRPAHPTTDFSVDLSRHLRDYIEEHEQVSVRLVAADMGRSQNYVYDRLSGLRPLDVDVLATVANLSHVDARGLLLTLTARMVTPKS